MISADEIRKGPLRIYTSTCTCNGLYGRAIHSIRKCVMCVCVCVRVFVPV